MWWKKSNRRYYYHYTAQLVDNSGHNIWLAGALRTEKPFTAYTVLEQRQLIIGTQEIEVPGEAAEYGFYLTHIVPCTEKD